MALRSWTKVSEWKSFEFCVFGAFALHLIVATRFPSVNWPDEIFQTLEQGHRWVFGYGTAPWEWRDGVRSWVYPGLLGLVMRATAFLGTGSSGYLLGIRIFEALCSVVPVAVAVQLAEREKLKYPWVAGAATAVWFELVFFSSKALTEVVAGYVLIAALFFCIERERPRAALWVGVLCGLAFSLRVHLAPAVLVVAWYACERELPRWKRLVPGFLGVVVFFGLVDWVTWGLPFYSFVMNVWVNLGKGKAASFGVTPPWEYVLRMAVVWSWATVPLMALAGLAFKRWPVFGITAGVILVSHSAIAHKEYRFLAPLLMIVVVAASVELTRLLETKRAWGLAACALWLLASADGARRYDIAKVDPRFAFVDFTSMWTMNRAHLRFWERLSKDDSVCGVANVALGWGWTGGYAYLHKNVPMFDIRTKTQMAEWELHFNYLIASPDNGETIGLFKRDTCDADICLYRREGPCTSAGDYDFSAWLAAQGN